MLDSGSETALCGSSGLPLATRFSDELPRTGSARGSRALGKLLACSFLAGAIGAVAPASAQSAGGQKAAAEALFRQGKQLMVDNQFAEACPKLEQSQRIDPAIGTLLYLAECYEKQGKTASAWATFSEAASLAQAEGQAERATLGKSRAQALEPKLSRLSLVVSPDSSEIDGFEVVRDGKPQDSSLWGVAVPVDPGEYAIVVRAPGYISHAEKIRVDGEGKTVELRLPPLVKTATTAPPSDGQPGANPPPGDPQPAAGPRADTGGDDGSGQRTLGIVVGGLGLAGVAIGSVFGLTAIGKNSDAEEFCPGGSTCTRQEGIDLTEDAKSAAQISNIAFGIGAAGIIGGLVLYLTAPDKPSSQQARSLQMAPVIDGKSAGLGLWGVFR